MNHDQKDGLLNLVSTPQINIYAAEYVEDLSDSYQEPDGLDTVCLMTETDSNIFIIEAVYQNHLSQDEKNRIGEYLEANVLAQQLERYNSTRQQASLHLPADLNLPLDSTHEYKEIIKAKNPSKH